MNHDLVYKVVFREPQPDGHVKYESSYVIGIVGYHIGKMVHPAYSGTPLFAFRTLEDAMRYVDGNPAFAILACQHGPEIKRSKMINASLPIPNEDFVRNFWSDAKYDLDLEFTEPLIEGTVLVEWLIPVRRIGGKQNDRQVHKAKV